MLHFMLACSLSAPSQADDMQKANEALKAFQEAMMRPREQATPELQRILRRRIVVPTPEQVEETSEPVSEVWTRLVPTEARASLTALVEVKLGSEDGPHVSWTRRRGMTVSTADPELVFDTDDTFEASLGILAAETAAAKLVLGAYTFARDAEGKNSVEMSSGAAWLGLSWSGQAVELTPGVGFAFDVGDFLHVKLGVEEGMALKWGGEAGRGVDTALNITGRNDWATGSGALEAVRSTLAAPADCPFCGSGGKFECPQCKDRKKATCPSCSGGRTAGCRRCGGDGRLSCVATVNCGTCGATGNLRCSACGGDGEVKTKCRTCGGTGITETQVVQGFRGSYGCTACGGRRGEPFNGSSPEFGKGRAGSGYSASRCDSCSGSGRKGSCGNCGGDGKAVCSRCGGDGNVNCGACDGSGKVRCGKCSGSGDVACPFCKGRALRCPLCRGGRRLEPLPPLPIPEPVVRAPEPAAEVPPRNPNCACRGAGCNCIKPLCGGTRQCGCGGTGTDCRCAPVICKFAGTTFCCRGSHGDSGKQRCDSTCGCGHEPGKCKCTVSCGCSRR